MSQNIIRDTLLLKIFINLKHKFNVDIMKFYHKSGNPTHLATRVILLRCKLAPIIPPIKIHQELPISEQSPCHDLPSPYSLCLILYHPPPWPPNPATLAFLLLAPSPS